MVLEAQEYYSQKVKKLTRKEKRGRKAQVITSPWVLYDEVKEKSCVMKHILGHFLKISDGTTWYCTQLLNKKVVLLPPTAFVYSQPADNKLHEYIKLFCPGSHQKKLEGEAVTHREKSADEEDEQIYESKRETSLTEDQVEFNKTAKLADQKMYKEYTTSSLSFNLKHQVLSNIAEDTTKSCLLSAWTTLSNS
jgi:hypothetical protein